MIPGSESGYASFWDSPPPSGLDELLRQARKLELIAGSHAVNLMRGDYLTQIPGQGLEFQEARKYVFGESIRQIDWNITARMRSPYVRVYQEEREREIFLVLDISPSMHAGWQSRRKIEYAVEMAVTIASSAVAAGDKLGFVTYCDTTREVSAPAKGRVQLFRLAKSFYTAAVSPPPACPVSDMRQAAHAIQRISGRNFVIFVFSDFIDFDVPDDLRYLQARHEVYLTHLYDPLEYDRTADLSFVSSSPEGRRRTGMIRPGRQAGLAETVAGLKEAAERLRIRYLPVSTGVPVDTSLRELIAAMKFRHRRAG